MHQHLSKVTEGLVASLDDSERWKKANASSNSENSPGKTRGRKNVE